MIINVELISVMPSTSAQRLLRNDRGYPQLLFSVSLYISMGCLRAWHLFYGTCFIHKKTLRLNTPLRLPQRLCIPSPALGHPAALFLAVLGAAYKSSRIIMLNLVYGVYM